MLHQNRIQHPRSAVDALMSTATEKTLLASFSDPTRIGPVVRRLRESGFDMERVSIIMNDSARAREMLEQGPNSPARAAVMGSALGGTLFGLAAVSLTGPLGLLAVGPLTAGLAAATAGAGAGGLLGALVGLGIPEHEAALRVDTLQDGGALLSFDLRNQGEEQTLRLIIDESPASEVFELER